MSTPSTDALHGKIERLEGTQWQKSRSFCPAVISEGGSTVWPGCLSEIQGIAVI